MNIDPTGSSWNSFWNGVGNWFENNWQWVAGASIIVGLGIATIITGGAAAGIAGFIVAGAFKGAVIGAISSTVIGSVIGGISSGSWLWDNALTGAKNGFFSGAMTGAITGAITSGIQIGQAAKMWQPGTSPRTSTSFKTMRHHYKIHGAEAKNIVTYTKDAVNFANRNASAMKFVVPYNKGLQPHWTVIGKMGMNGQFTSSGKILTFWYVKL